MNYTTIIDAIVNKLVDDLGSDVKKIVAGPEDYINFLNSGKVLTVPCINVFFSGDTFDEFMDGRNYKQNVRITVALIARSVRGHSQAERLADPIKEDIEDSLVNSRLGLEIGVLVPVGTTEPLGEKTLLLYPIQFKTWHYRAFNRPNEP